MARPSACSGSTKAVLAFLTRASREHLYLGDEAYEPEDRDAHHLALDLRKVGRGDHELFGPYIDPIDADIIDDAA